MAYGLFFFTRLSGRPELKNAPSSSHPASNCLRPTATFFILVGDSAVLLDIYHYDSPTFRSEDDPRTLLVLWLVTISAAIREIKLETRNKRKTVLCIDHQPLPLLIRKILLEHAGYAVLTAESEQEGLQIFASGVVDAVVLHNFLGEVDGGRVSAQMKHMKPDAPVILLLNSGDEPVAALPVVDVFMNTLNSPNILLAKLAEVLHRKHSSVA